MTVFSVIQEVSTVLDAGIGVLAIVLLGRAMALISRLSERVASHDIRIQDVERSISEIRPALRVRMVP